MRDHLDKLRDWWERHGSSIWKDADEWINSLNNVELLETFEWFEKDQANDHRQP